MEPKDETPHVPVLSFVAKLAERSLSKFAADNCPHFAASIAFRVLFSLFPLVIVLTAVFSIVVRSTGVRADVVSTIVDNVPLTGDGKVTLQRLLEGVTSSLSTVGLVGVVGLIWAASGMMAAIRAGLNEAWGVEHRRPFLQGKLLDLLLLLGVAVLILVSFGMTIAMRSLQSYAADLLADAGLGSTAVSWLLAVVAPLFLSFAATLVLYTVVPANRPRARDVWPAALFVAAVFALGENLFALYIQHFGSYNEVYGSLGAVIAFLFFVYVAASVFLLGAEIASQWRPVRRELARGGDGDGTPFREQVKDFLVGLAVRRDQGTGDEADERRPGER